MTGKLEVYCSQSLTNKAYVYQNALGDSLQLPLSVHLCEIVLVGAKHVHGAKSSRWKEIGTQAKTVHLSAIPCICHVGLTPTPPLAAGPESMPLPMGTNTVYRMTNSFASFFPN